MNVRKYTITLVVTGIAVLLLAACTAVTRVPAGGTSEAAATPDLTADDGEGGLAGADATTIAVLGALSYTGLFEAAPITLTKGIYTYTDASSGDQFQVRLLDSFAVYGDLDGDDTTDAVAALELDARGSGRFTYLAPVLDVWNTPRPGPAIEVGDRIQVQSITLADGQVVVDYIGQGPGDGDCCPSYNRRNTYAWEEGSLMEISKEELGRAELPAGEQGTASTPTDELAAAFGPPSQAAFGSAVFFEQSPGSASLEETAQAQYRYFVGDLWERYGADAWLGTWQKVYERPAGVERDIVAELRAIPDRGAAQAVELLLDAGDDPQAAQEALATAFDDPAVTELSVYRIGDGAALAGILLAARRAAGATTILVFLLD